VPLLDPLPFRLSVPGLDRIDLRGARSVSWKLAGLLHHEGDQLVFEWAGTRTTEGLTLSGPVNRVEPVEPEAFEVPIEWVAEAWLVGGWWWPRFVVRARRLDAFDGIPGAGPGRVAVRIHPRHRELARAMAAEINR
jgi:hypothetical protein